MKRKALGKGLGSLIPSAPKAPAPRGAPSAPEAAPHEIDLDRIRPNRAQPREQFAEGSLDELAASLRAHGVLQPVVVRKAADGGFELIAGERRWRAAQKAGFLKVPAIVREVPDDRLLEVALVENLQRENLNPIEEAQAFRGLMTALGATQAEVADRVGRGRPTVANALRLLSLPKAVQDRVRAGELSAGHARAIAGLSSPKRQSELAELAIRGGWSVRQTETAVAREGRDAPTQGARPARTADPNVGAAAERLQRALGTRVRIVQGSAGRGRIELHFADEDELRRIFDIVYGAARTAG